MSTPESELAKVVIDAVKVGIADEALAVQVAKDIAALEPLAMYHFVVQVAGGLRDAQVTKEGLANFNQLLAKQPAFVEAMGKLNAAKEAGQLKPA